MDIQLFNDLIKNCRSIFPDQFVAGKKSRGYYHSANTGKCYLGTQSRYNSAWHFTVFTGGGLQAFTAFQSSLYKQ